MKKRNLRYLSVLLFIFVLIVSGCSSSDDNEGNSSVNGGKVEETENTKVSIEESVILDKEGILITVKSFEEDGFFGPSLKVLVENNSDDTVTVQTRNSSVNGIMIETMLSVDVEPGKNLMMKLNS